MPFLRRRRAPAVVSLALGLGLCPALVACSGDDDGGPTALPDTSSSPASAAPATPTPPVATKATIRRVVGSLAPQAREKLKDKITAAVDAWIDGAYVGGDYPRSDFGDAFVSFTPQARVRARQDERLMSNARIGEQVDDVEVFARRIRIDALAAQGRASAVTVEVLLGLGLSGEIERRERILGQLYLTFADGDWRVFGYDVKRGTV